MMDTQKTKKKENAHKMAIKQTAREKNTPRSIKIP
jgi:hypothetical protein